MLKTILSISGKPGLYKLVSQAKNMLIVESLADGKRTNIPSTSRVSSLTDISVFTQSEDKPLADIFTALFEQTGGKPTIGHKEDARKIESVFASVVPDYDVDKVHLSDMKKIIQWYNILVNAGMTEFKLPQEDVTEEKEQ